MNCEQARLLIGAEPGNASAELAEHLQGCAACATFRDEMLTLDASIQRALQRPPQLAARRAPRAAAHLAAVGAGGERAAGLHRHAGRVAAATERHAGARSGGARRGGAGQLAERRSTSPPQGINEALRSAGVQLDVTSDKIIYAQSCWFRGHYVPHLVLQTSQGPATVLILRHETATARRSSFHEAGMSGVIVPAQTGSIAAADPRRRRQPARAGDAARHALAAGCALAREATLAMRAPVSLRLPAHMEPKLVTRPEDRTALEQLRRLEPIFHRPEYSTPAALEQLVAPDFWEIGASGRRYSRQYVLRTLAARAGHPIADEWQTSDFHCRGLGANVYLLTYTLLQGERRTHRATLWQRDPAGWKILFHQGTVVEDEDEDPES